MTFFSIRSHLSWMLAVFTSELRRAFAYRIDFWIQLVFTVLAHVGCAFFLWRAIFTAQHVTTMQGYSFSGLMFYYTMIPILHKILTGPTLGQISKEIYEGALTRYLVYPVNFFCYKYMQYLATAILYLANLCIALILFFTLFGIPADISFTVISVTKGLIALAIAGFLGFLIAVSLELVAFWADNVWTLLVMVRFCVSLLGGILIPLSFFPNSAQTVLYYLPFSSLAAWPIESFMGTNTTETWLRGLWVTVAWSIVFIVVCRHIWLKGRHAYTGVGI